MASSVATPEDEVIDALARIETLDVPFCAVRVAMSRLKPENRGYRQLEIVSHLFEPLLNYAGARLFLLSNTDFLLLTAYPVLPNIDNVLQQIYSLFADDPFFLTVDKKHFFQTFFLNKDKAALEASLKGFSEIKQQPIPQVVRPQPEPQLRQELTADSLQALLVKMQQLTGPCEFLRRQSVIYFDSMANNQEEFQDFFVCVSDLEKSLLPNVNLKADKSFFGVLTESLDKIVLSDLPRLQLTHYPKAVCVTLNVKTVLQSAFDEMTKSLPCSLIVGFRASDVIQQYDSYRQACEKLKQLQIPCALDDVGVFEFERLVLSSFDVQYIKLLWSDYWQKDADATELHDFVTTNKKIQVVLKGCDSQKALLFGCRAGVRLFQGSFIDHLSAQMAKQACTFGLECSLDDCMYRRSVLFGQARHQCVHEPHLDTYAPLKEK